MKKLLIVSMFLIGCTSQQVDITGDAVRCELGFRSYSIHFVDDNKMVIVKNGGGDVYFDTVVFMIDGKVREFKVNPHFGQIADIDIDRNFINEISSARFITWRPTEYENNIYDFRGEHTRRIREYGQYFTR